MSNDGWGKLPANSDWGKLVVSETQAGDFASIGVAASNMHIPSELPTSWPSVDIKKALAIATGAWPKPAVSDDWGSGFASSDWGRAAGIHPDQTSPMTVGPEEFFSDDAPTDAEVNAEFEQQWTRDSLEGAHNRASVINSLRGTKDEYTIDQDGQLDNVTETVRAKKTGEPTGFYLAYSDGKWLHAILSGPYDTPTKALAQTDVVWAKFTDDSAFKLAFSNKFNRDGVYCAEIPLSAKRKGAYGVLT